MTAARPQLVCVRPSHIGLSPPSRQSTKFQQSSLRLEVLACRKRRTSCFPHMALAPRSVGAASGTDAGRCLAGSLGAARLPTRRRAAMAQPQRLALLGSRPGAAEIGAPSHRLQHPRGTAVLPTPPRPANSIRRAVVKGRGAKCRRRRAVPLSDVRRPAAAGVRKSSITLFGVEVLAGFQAPPLRPVALDFASKAGAMPRRSHRLRPPLLPQTGQTTVSPSPISPLAVASRLPSCRE